jgi:hypothetical protein
MRMDGLKIMVCPSPCVARLVRAHTNVLLQAQHPSAIMLLHFLFKERVGETRRNCYSCNLASDMFFRLSLGLNGSTSRTLHSHRAVGENPKRLEIRILKCI